MKTLLEKLAEIGNRAQFASLIYTSKESGETARHTLILGASYVEMVRKAKLALELVPESELVELGIDSTLAAQAKADVLKSFSKTLATTGQGLVNEDYSNRNTYLATAIPGVKLNITSGELALFGLALSRVVITPGVHKQVNSKPLTIAKRKIERHVRTLSPKTFIVKAELFDTMQLNGATIEL